jgi:proteasome lid subunit RPN8/RPN11
MRNEKNSENNAENGIAKARISSATIETIIEAARNTYPDEFIALLGKTRNREIDEIIVLPATYGNTFSSLRLDLLPYTEKTAGSVHSHPSTSNRPSRADLNFFRELGGIHLIIAFPFNMKTIRAFDSGGKEIVLEVV